MATVVHKYVVTNSTSLDGNSVSGDGSIGNPWNSLRGLQNLSIPAKNLVNLDETWIVHVSATGGYWDNQAKTSQLVLSNFNTDVDHQLVITGDAQYHNGHIPLVAFGTPFGTNTIFTSYVLAKEVDGNALLFNSDFITIRGFAVMNYRDSRGTGLMVPSTDDITIDRMLVYGTDVSGNNFDRGILINSADRVTLKNTLFFGFRVGLSMLNASSGHEIHNNTFYNSGSGSATGVTLASGTSGKFTNNIIQNSSGFDLDNNGTWTTNNNLTEDATGDIQATLTFADLSDRDLHLAPTDTAAMGTGSQVVGVTEDIDQEPRTAAFWNVGFDQTVEPFVKTSISDFVFIFNHAADEATSISLIEGTKNSHDHFKNENIASGPRSRRWRSTETTDNKAIGYIFDSRNINAFVLTEAYFANSLYGYNVDIGRYGGSWAWTAIEEPLSSASLIGKSGQDVVCILEDKASEGVGVRFRPATGDAQAIQFSSLIAGEYLNIGSPDVANAQVADIKEDDRRFKHLRGTDAFLTEKQITLRFSGISKAQFEAFRSMPGLYRWPFVIYDPSQYVFPHKLEHVILADWEAEQIDRDLWSLQMILRRIKHYEHSNYS